MAQIHATYQLRCHIRKGGHVRLDEVRRMLNTLYNAALQERRDAYRMAGKSVNLYEQQGQLTDIRADVPEWSRLHVGVARGVLRRVERAMNAFFRRVKAGETPGYPRFKPVSRFQCIEVAEPRIGMVKIAQDGRKAYIRIKGLPVIELRLKQPLPSSDSLKALRLVQRANGWYADLVYAVEKAPLSPCADAVGIDVGVNNRIALSNGEVIVGAKSGFGKSRRGRRLAPRPVGREHHANGDTDYATARGASVCDGGNRLLRLHQTVSRRQRGSNRRRKAVKSLAREHRRRVVRNRNECHRLTTDLVRRFGRIAVEALSIQDMTRSAKGTVEEPGRNVAAKSGLNREILVNTWGLIRDQLRYKAEWAGREFVTVNPRYTSRICSECGSITPQSEYRTYRCGVCGVVIDRDTNAALNVLQRAFGPTGVRIPPASCEGREQLLEVGA